MEPKIRVGEQVVNESTMLAFCRARLDEDERAARRAGDTFREIGETGVIVATEGDRAEECASVNWAGIAEHIVRQDPARTLREAEAKRRLLDAALADHHHISGDQYETCPRATAADGLDAGTIAVLKGLNEERHREDGVEPKCSCGRDARVRRTLELLALPYSDHPEYEEAWRP